jgi:hypothetical protein
MNMDHAIKVMEFQLADKKHWPVVQRKMEELFTDEERATIEIKVEDGRIILHGLESLIQRLIASLGA